MMYKMLWQLCFSGLGRSLPGCASSPFIKHLAAKPAFPGSIRVNGLGAGRKTFGR
jgi:hypothetical protein